MKKNKIVGAILTGVLAIGTAFGVAKLLKKDDENGDCEADSCEEENYDEDDSEEESE